MRAARALLLMLFGLLARSSAPPTAVAEAAAAAAPPAAAWARAHVELPAARLAAHAAAALDAGPLMYAYRAGVHDSRSGGMRSAGDAPCTSLAGPGCLGSASFRARSQDERAHRANAKTQHAAGTSGVFGLAAGTLGNAGAVGFFDMMRRLSGPSSGAGDGARPTAPVIDEDSLLALGSDADEESGDVGGEDDYSAHVRAKRDRAEREAVRGVREWREGGRAESAEETELAELGSRVFTLGADSTGDAFSAEEEATKAEKWSEVQAALASMLTQVSEGTEHRNNEDGVDDDDEEEEEEEDETRSTRRRRRRRKHVVDAPGGVVP